MTILVLLGALTVSGILIVVLCFFGDRRTFRRFPVIAPFQVPTALAAVAVGFAQFTTTAAFAADSPARQALLGARQWLNTAPLQAADLRGKVVLVNFWTYSCINSLRALPYVRAWADKYKDRGFVTVGAHAPEFGFEKDIANVRQATSLYDVRYPVATDNNFKIWNSFDNEAWPAFYLIGADGRVRLRMLGEGDYDKIERVIQQLLSEASGTSMTGDIATVAGQGVQAPADESNLLSPETYVGYAKAHNFASTGGAVAGAAKLYQLPSTLRLNHWGLAGVWNVSDEFATLNQAPGSIRFRFHARDLHFVLVPSVPGQPVRFRVKLDGASPGDDRGVDIDAEGSGAFRNLDFTS
jgi:thiol-disulfide isomerase/thioredoxin